MASSFCILIDGTYGNGKTSQPRQGICLKCLRAMMEEFGYPLEKALDIIYSSHVPDPLQHKEGELYIQSPSYVYELLLKEEGLRIVNETVNGD